MKKIRVLFFRSQTYDLPITTSDSLPLDYRRLVGATITGESLGTLTLLGWFSYLVSSVVLNTKKYKHVNKFITRLKSPVQARKYLRPGNDPRTRNDPQTGLANDPGPEMVTSSIIKNGMDSKKGKELYLNDFVCLRHVELITDERETKTSTKFSYPTRHEFLQVESRKVAWFSFFITLPEHTSSCKKVNNSKRLCLFL